MYWVEKLYLKYFVASGFEYAGYLKKKGLLHEQGNGCFISKGAEITDPYLVSIGDNVWITADCRLLCHDASVIMINAIEGSHLDRVGAIFIGNNCFLGNGVTVLPDVRIGSNTVVGTGSVVTRDIPDNTVWAGNPVRQISTFQDFVGKAQKRTLEFPWHHLLKKNGPHIFDSQLESQLRVERKEYFFGTNRCSFE